MQSLSQGEISNFKELAKAYFQVDEQIRSINESLSDKKALRKDLEAKITLFMRNHKIDDISTDKGALRCTVSTTKKPLNKKCLKNMLCDFFDNNLEKTDECFKFLENRETVEKVKLKIVS